MKKYMICFITLTTNGINGYGDAIVNVKENDDIYTEDYLTKVKETIIEKRNLSSCIIQNIIPLND